jgi:hypothetical protein
MADADKLASQQEPADERPSTQAMQFAIFTVIIVLILRRQHVPAGTDVERLQGARWQTVAIAIGFAASIPLYLLIGQRAFAVWAIAPILSNFTQAALRRRHPKVGIT